jgi:transposase
MAYSIDFRKKAIEYWNKGHTKEELYEAFGVYPSRVSDWKKLLRETGSLEPQYRETRNRTIDPKRLEQEIERNPDFTFPELAKIFNCTKQAVDAAYKRLKITRKKDIFIRRKRLDKGNVLRHGVAFIPYFCALTKHRFC